MKLKINHIFDITRNFQFAKLVTIGITPSIENYLQIAFDSILLGLRRAVADTPIENTAISFFLNLRVNIPRERYEYCDALNAHRNYRISGWQMPQRARNLLKSEDINRVFTTKWREGSVLRMEEMTNQCTAATGSSRIVLHARSWQHRGTGFWRKTSPRLKCGDCARR